MSARNRGIIILVVVALTIALSWVAVRTPTPVPSYVEPQLVKTPTPVPTPSTVGNLLVNPSFESPYECPGSALCAAQGWHIWYMDPPSCDPWLVSCWVTKPSNCFDYDKGKYVKDYGCYWQRPEFGEITLQYPRRLHSGSSAQKAFTYGRMGMYGLWQSVMVAPGTPLRFSVYMQGWMCSQFTQDNCRYGEYSDAPSTFHFKIGIDPYGGTSPTSTNIIWSPEGDSFDAYKQFEVVARAKYNSVTVFTRVWTDWDWARINNDVYIDDARLEVLGPPAPVERKTYIPFMSYNEFTGVVPFTPTTNLGGVHVEVTGSHDRYGAYLEACHLADRPVGLIKAVCDGGSLMQAKVTDPRTHTVYRCYTPDGHGDTMDNPAGDYSWSYEQTEGIAKAWMQANYPNWDLNKQYVDWFEVVNEPNPSNITQTINLNNFFMYAMKEAENHGIHLAIGSFSSGTPEPWQVPYLEESFKYAAQHGHVLAIHDGSVDDTRRTFQEAYQDGTALRYRMIQTFLGQYMPYVVITEGYQPDGYRRPVWSDWQWYLNELSKDRVLGVAWFTLGSYDFGGEEVNIVGQLPGYAEALGCGDINQTLLMSK